MIINYKEFFRKFKIFEAEEKKNKSIELAKDFVIKNYRARALADKKSEAKRIKLEEEPEINEDDLKNFINSIKLTEEEIKELSEKAENDQFLNRIIKVCDIRPEWTDLFVRLFFTSFKQYKINPNPAGENSDFRKISSLLGSYNYDTIAKKIIWHKTNLDEDNIEVDDFGDITIQIRNLNDLPKEVQKEILSKFPEYIKLQKQAWSKREEDDNDNNSDSRSAEEMLSDDIRDLGQNYYINSLIERLPRGIKINGKVEYNLYEEYQNLNDGEFKRKIRNAFGELYDVFRTKNINLKPERNKKGEIIYPYEKIFKIRAGSAKDKQLDKSLNDFYKRLKGTLDSFNNASASKLMDLLMETNAKFGEDSTDIVYNENNIIIFSVKNYKVNHYLHDKSDGKSIKTKHCIAYSETSWNSYMRDGEDIYNKLYYVYDFNLDPTSENLPFGVIINLEGNIDSSHNKLDHSFSHRVPDFFEKRKIPISILSPMSEEEVMEIDRTIGASKLLVKPDISSEKLRDILESGADPNTKNNTPLFNAINIGNVENIKILLEFNAKITDQMIEKLFETNNIEIIKPFIEMEKLHPFKFLVKFIEYDNNSAVEYLLEANKRMGNKPYETGILEHVKSFNMVVTLLKHGYILATRDADDLYPLIFPENKMLNSYNMDEIIKITKIILDHIPYKKNRSTYTLSAADLLENAIAFGVDDDRSDKLKYFKFIMNEAIERFLDDEYEDDFIQEYLNRGIPMKRKYANIMAKAIDEIYEKGSDKIKAKIKIEN